VVVITETAEIVEMVVAIAEIEETATEEETEEILDTNRQPYIYLKSTPEEILECFFFE